MVRRALPRLPAPIGRYVSQPINSIVRGPDGAIYMPTDSTGRDSDGNGSISVVWKSTDDGRTWSDTGGRTAGRHTTIVFAHNGDLLGFGGKNSQHRRPHAARHLARRRQNVDQIQTPLRPPRQRRTSLRHSPLSMANSSSSPMQIQRTRNTSTKTAPTSRSPPTTARPGPSSACLRTSSPLATPPPRKAPTASSTSPPPRTPSTTRSNSTKPGSSTRTQAT